MAPRYGLDGRVVLVTGAAGGIGRALAAAFAAQGAYLVLVDRDAGRLDSVVTALARQVTQRYGQLAVLVNNAGTEYRGALADAAVDAMARCPSCLTTTLAAWCARPGQHSHAVA